MMLCTEALRTSCISASSNPQDCVYNHLPLVLSPYLCFISFLNLDLYVLKDDAFISLGSFMQTKHLCALIHI